MQYRVGKKGRPGTQIMEFGSDKEFLKFTKKYNLIGYKGLKEPFSKKGWLRYQRDNSKCINVYFVDQKLRIGMIGKNIYYHIMRRDNTT